MLCERNAILTVHIVDMSWKMSYYEDDVSHFMGIGKWLKNRLQWLYCGVAIWRNTDVTLCSPLWLWPFVSQRLAALLQLFSSVTQKRLFTSLSSQKRILVTDKQLGDRNTESEFDQVRVGNLWSLWFLASQVII